MKTAVVLIATLALAFAAPQPKKSFNEHYQDFLNLIDNEVGDDLEHILMDHYMEYEEFQSTLSFMESGEFEAILEELITLPEFEAFYEYLVNFEINLSQILKMPDMMKSRMARHNTSGKDATAFFKDVFNLLPAEKIVALYEQKISEDESFKAAVETLQNEEFRNVFSRLWSNEVFQKHVTTLSDNGLDLVEVYNAWLEVFGLSA